MLVAGAPLTGVVATADLKSALSGDIRRRPDFTKLLLLLTCCGSLSLDLLSRRLLGRVSAVPETFGLEEALCESGLGGIDPGSLLQGLNAREDFEGGTVDFFVPPVRIFEDVVHDGVPGPGWVIP